MIATISKGKGARGLLAYLVGDPKLPRGIRVAGNMAGRTLRELAAEFGLVRKMRPTLGRAIAHVSGCGEWRPVPTRRSNRLLR
jgi:hypothetical protein